MLSVAKGLQYAHNCLQAMFYFSLAAQSYAKGVYAILLGGFGADGVEGLTEVQKKSGASVVQHPEEAQFPYAPQKAIELGMADEVLRSRHVGSTSDAVSKSKLVLGISLELFEFYRRRIYSAESRKPSTK